MATDQSDIIQVKPEELVEPAVGGLAGAPAVHLDDVEEVKPSEGQKDASQAVQQTPASEKKSAPVTHETENVKSTYDGEEDPKLSTKTKIKEKLVHLGDKLRPKDAVDAKNADPHPGMM